MTYGAHGFAELERLYQNKPYQGQDPRSSCVIFLGRDANYPQALAEAETFFQLILEYHKNGVAFWEKYRLHHPFLHPENPFIKYKDQRFKAGVRYHKIFAKMGLDPGFAKHISFVEILNKATSGNTGEDKHNWFYQNIDDKHIQWLEEVLLGPSEKTVFVPKTVLSVDLAKVYRKTGRFKWLLDADHRSTVDTPECILEKNESRFFKCGHFSGAITNSHLSAISSVIRRSVG